MKLACYMDISSLTTPHSGGVFNYSLELIKKISILSEKHEVVFFVNSLQDETFIKKLCPTIQVLILPKLNKLTGIYLYALTDLYTCFHFHKRKKAIQAKKRKLLKDFVTHNKIKMILYLSEFVCLDPDIPFFTNVLDLAHKKISFFPEISTDGKFDVRQNGYEIIRRAARILVESEAGKKDLMEFYSIHEKNIVVLPLFPLNFNEIILENNFSNDFLTKHNLEKGCFIFYPAQFWPHKNHYNLLKAFAKVNEAADYKLKLVFTGSDKGNLNYIKQTISDFNLNEYVKILGFISQKELKVLYQEALTLVMPTFLGQTNLPPLEAASLGCPVICSDFGGHKEMLKDCAIYINPENDDEIKDNILLLYNNSSVREMYSKKIKTHFENSDFTAENSVKIISKAISDFENYRNCWN